MKEFIVNDYIVLRLIDREIVIYIKDQRFNQCKFLLFNLSTDNIEQYDDIISIDELESKYSRQSEGKHFIDPETEFWAHCSNIQAWAENNYDTRILHRTIAFPILKKLTDLGDPVAKKVFKGEIAQRLETGAENVFWFLLEQNYLNYLTIEEIDTILANAAFRNKILTAKSTKRNVYRRFNLEHYLVSLSQKGSDKAIDILKEVIIASGKNLENFRYFKKNGYLKYLIKEELDQIMPNDQTLKSIEYIINLEKFYGTWFQSENEEDFLKNIKSQPYKLRIHFSYLIKENEVLGIHIRKERGRETSFPQILLKLRNLRYLMLSGLMLKELPRKISLLDKLRFLSLKGSRIKNIPISIGELKNLEYLALPGTNHIQIIPGFISNFLNLKVLKIDTYTIKIFPKSLGNLKTLEELDLGNYNTTSLEKFPEFITQLSNLKILNLQNNKIKTLPENIGVLKNLEILNLEGNLLNSLPESLGQIRSLKELNISKNQLKSLPTSIGNLVNLKILNFRGNKLEFLPSSMENLKTLATLIFWNNPLKEVPTWYNKLPNFDISKIYPLIEIVLNIGSPKAEELVWKEIVSAFKKGNLSIIDTLLHKKIFEKIKLERYEHILLNSESIFQKGLRENILKMELDQNLFHVILELVRKGSKKIYQFIHDMMPKLIKSETEEELKLLTKYLFFLNDNDFNNSVSQFNSKQIKGLMRAFLIEFPFESSEIHNISEFGQKVFKFIYILIEKIQEQEYKQRIIEELFIYSGYSYCLGLSKEEEGEFIEGLSDSLTHLFIKILLNYIVRNFNMHGMFGEGRSYLELRRPINSFIRTKNSIWNEEFLKLMENNKDEKGLELLIFLYIEKFLDELSQGDLIKYFDFYPKDEIVQMIIHFYQQSDYERGIYIQTNDFLKLGDLGINLAFSLIENIHLWADWEDVDRYTKILKELKKQHPDKVKQFLKDLADNLEEFGNDMHFEFIFFRILPLLTRDKQEQILLNRGLKITKWILEIEDIDSRYDALEKMLDFRIKIDSILILIEDLIKEKSVSDEIIYDLCKSIFEKIDEKQFLNLIYESDFISNILKRFKRKDSFHYYYYSIPFYNMILLNLNNQERIISFFSKLDLEVRYKILSSLIGDLVDSLGYYSSELKKVLRTILLLTNPLPIIKLFYIQMEQCRGYPDFYNSSRKIYLDALKLSHNVESDMFSYGYVKGETFHTAEGKILEYTCNIELPDGRKFIGGYVRKTHTIAVVSLKTKKWVIGFTDEHKVINWDEFFGNPLFHIPNTTILVAIFRSDLFLYDFYDNIKNIDLF